MSDLKSIPLQSFYEQKGARFVDFAGWNMPVQFTSIIKEHEAVRKRVGLFDVSHMGEIIVTGEGSIDYLNYLLTNDFTNLAPGNSKYTMMCYEDGGVVDDLIVYALEPHKYLLCVNASNCDKDFAWMQQHATNFEVDLSNVSEDYALLALQGPMAAEFLLPLQQSTLDDLGRFAHIETELAGVEVILSRTGYTGEDGFEIYIPANTAESVLNALDERAQELELEDFYCGLGCRDSLRLEAGYPLYGHEIDSEIDPIRAGLGWTVKLNKADDFRGKSSLSDLKTSYPRKVVHFYKIEDRRIARQGESVYQGDSVVGRVLSGTYSPITGGAIGSLILDDVSTTPEGLTVELRGKSLDLKITRPPLHLTK